MAIYHIANKELIFGTGPATCSNGQVAQKSTIFPLFLG
jgi:hypothetical protein